MKSSSLLAVTFFVVALSNMKTDAVGNADGEAKRQARQGRVPMGLAHRWAGIGKRATGADQQRGSNDLTFQDFNSLNADDGRLVRVSERAMPTNFRYAGLGKRRVGLAMRYGGLGKRTMDSTAQSDQQQDVEESWMNEQQELKEFPHDGANAVNADVKPETVLPVAAARQKRFASARGSRNDASYYKRERPSHRGVGAGFRYAGIGKRRSHVDAGMRYMGIGKRED